MGKISIEQDEGESSNFNKEAIVMKNRQIPIMPCTNYLKDKEEIKSL